MKLFSAFLTLVQRAAASRHAGAQLAATLAMTSLTEVSLAQASGGLQRAQSTLETLKSNLDIILPIAAIVIGVIIFVLYSAEVMRKDDAIRWGIGVLLAGSVGELVALLWK